MCAAPGSKTSQMLEALVRGGVVKKLKEPEGFIVANDADTNRAYMLVRRGRGSCLSQSGVPDRVQI